MKLTITKSPRKDKKFVAKFYEGSKLKKTTHFGAKGMKERRKRYRDRHKKDLKTKDPTRAGYLSYYILWGDSSNIKTAIKNYKKKFKFS